jgi:hypothetical protein
VRWEKLGRVYVAAGEEPWTRSHAFPPTPLPIDAGRLRVFVAFLDEQRVGRIGWVDVATADPRCVLAVSPQPVLDVGVPGAFDDNGVTPLFALRHGSRVLLYYTGWQLGTRARYFLFTGLAASDDGGESFTRLSQAPLLDRSDGELFVRTAPCVLADAGRWRMWYIGGDRWIRAAGKEVPSYDLRYLESDDPTRWPRQGRVCLEPTGEDEFGFGRPWVVCEGGRYRMWYSIRTRSRGYRLGYAESRDGLQWERRDAEVGLDVSSDGWDSEMVCYSAVESTEHGTYLFYNGNNYGETGFGVARLVD